MANKKWLLTEYEKREEPGAGKTSATPGLTGASGTAHRPTDSSLAPIIFSRSKDVNTEAARLRRNKPGRSIPRPA